MKHVFIINSVAGVSDRTKEVTDKVKALLPEEDYIIFQTKREGNAENFIEQLLKEKPGKYRFYACGGDGTLNAVVNATYGYDVEVTNYPIGSGNDYLKYFGDKEKFKDLEKLINGKVIESDILKFNDKYCVNIFNVGFDAKVVSFQRNIKRLPLISGTLAYNISVALCALGRLSHKFKLTVDGETLYDGKAILAAMANSICYGGGFYCAPVAKIDDGLIDVCLIKKLGLLKFAKLIKYYKNGTFLENEEVMKYVIYKQCKHVELELSKPLYYANDGEIAKTTKVVIDIIPKAIKFIVPAQE